jgi:hypothetical protein
VQEDDGTAFRVALSHRLAKCIGGLHFQVAERALLLWQSERFASIMLDSPVHRPIVLNIIFPSLYINQEDHWHESIRLCSQRVLEQYNEIDPDLVWGCKVEYDSKLAAETAASVRPPDIQMPKTPMKGAAASPVVRSPHSPMQSTVSSPSHPHRAPAVRSSSGFSSMPDADLLPGSHGKHKPREINLLSLPPGESLEGRDE